MGFGLKIVLAESEYIDKVRGCWLGKSIGGTLGGPYEGRKEVFSLKFYDPVPEKPLPNDDLDLQLVWLHALQTRGVDITCHDLAQEWLDHIIYPFNEYGYAACNLRKGLRPPLSGSFNNWYVSGMGAPIRSEIWALIAPASPSVAAEYAYKDAIVDHSVDGLYGELFLSALESAAFVESDPLKLVQIGLSFIPENSRISQAVLDTVMWHDEGLDWLQCRERIVEKYGHYDMTDAPQNHAFIVLGWLYGGDFGDKICKAVNCGYDTDCTGATLASILGIIHGASGIPKEWKDPIAEEIVVGWGVVNFRHETNIEGLVKETYEVAKQVIASKCSHIEILPQIEKSDLSQSDKVNWIGLKEARRVDLRSPHIDVRRIRDFLVAIDYHGLPTITYDRSKRVAVKLTNKTARRAVGTLSLKPAVGWKLKPGNAQAFNLEQDETAELPFEVLVPDSLNNVEVSNWIHAEIHGVKQTSTTAFDFVLIGEPIWFVAGPFKGEGEEALHTVYGVEKSMDIHGKIRDLSSLGFKRTTFPENETRIEKWFGGKPGVIYAYTSVHCPEDREVKIGAACNDGVKVWLNGTAAINNHSHGDAPPAPHVRPDNLVKEVRLKEGWNNLLFKLVRCHKPIYLNFFIVDTTSNGSHGFVDLANTYLPE